MKVDEILKFGGVATGFFFIQTVGYLNGFGVYSIPSEEQALIFGLQHLLHILKPLAPVAWPLAPVITGLIFALSLFLTEVLDIMRAKGWAKAYVMAVALVTSVSLYVLAGYALGAPIVADLYQDLVFSWSRLPINIGYMIGFPAFAYVVYVILCRKGLSVPSKSEKNEKAVRVLLMGWLMLLLYAGSYFDGSLDRFSCGEGPGCSVDRTLDQLLLSMAED